MFNFAIYHLQINIQEQSSEGVQCIIRATVNPNPTQPNDPPLFSENLSVLVNVGFPYALPTKKSYHDKIFKATSHTFYYSYYNQTWACFVLCVIMVFAHEDAFFSPLCILKCFLKFPASEDA